VARMFVSDGDQVQVRDSACESWSSGQNLGSPKGNGQVWAEKLNGSETLANDAVSDCWICSRYLAGKS
jgi:hypothetical protein